MANITGDSNGPQLSSNILSRFYGGRNPAKNLQRQQKVLKKLLETACESSFGKQYNFNRILDSPDILSAFQQAVPCSNYLTMKEWWKRCMAGESDVVTAGSIKYFALSSGTSDGSSKFIPVSKKQLSQFKRESIRFSFYMALNSDIPKLTFSKDNLLIGGSTMLNYNGIVYTGDLSGIAQLHIPLWYQTFSKPDKEVRQLQWEEKIERMVQDAPHWDVGMITGIPSWVQLVLERIIERYQLKNIHQLWPNLKIYIHSGISAEPYIKSINNLFGEEVFWYESYLASEGFFAYKDRPGAEGMKLILGDGVFYEFVPFNDENFDEGGNLKDSATALNIQDVSENTDYALLITTNAGSWRYLIGDTVRFTDKYRAEIKVTGRTKHFLSVTGEHLSVDNMNQAVKQLADTLNFKCAEYTVYAEKRDGGFIHVWNIGCDKEVDLAALKTLLDESLMQLNDDYKTERRFALQDIIVKTLPNQKFYDFLSRRGKTGGQVKFPRVIKGDLLEAWKREVE
jgi:GH3 auxin-responsive promoter